MPSRIALSSNTILRFSPDIFYTIKGEVGRGGSCIVYDAVYHTNAGDDKTVRIKECYPYAMMLERDPSGSLLCPAECSDKFDEAAEKMYADFRLCNRLFYAEAASDSIINTINIYKANNTVYTVSAWRRENVLSSDKVNSLRDCVSIVRQTAFAIQCIHKEGYLYLDIKPDNISVVDGLTKRIQLFDFDCLIPISDLNDRIKDRPAYTKGFAALELRRGQVSRLGPHTDVYGIGALFFYLLFGRTPEAPDCISGAAYDFSAMRFFGQTPDRMFVLLSNFFHKTLAGFPADRWQNMEDVIRALETIERLADPIYPYLVSTPIDPPVYFIGRTDELKMLETWYENKTHQNLFVTGMGGIGKSTLIKSFLGEHRDEWDSILFLYYKNNLRQTITDDTALRINGTERLPEEKESDYFLRKTTKLREILARDQVILVIDNFEDYHDSDLDRILELDCRKIFITRQKLGSLNLPVFTLDAIHDPEDLTRMFIHYLDREISSTDEDVINTIIRQLAGHTLAVELFARQIANSFLSLSDAYELLRKQGILHAQSERVDYLRDNRISYEQLEAIITRLFETDSLSAEQVRILKAAALFPAPGIETAELIRLADVNSPDMIITLIRYGWITQDHDRIFLHPLIRDVISDLPVTDTTLECVQHVLGTLYDDIKEESHKEEIYKDEIPAVFGCGITQITDPENIITDQKKLIHSVTTARGVIDVIINDRQLYGQPSSQKLQQVMTINLPTHEDEAILTYGKSLLDHPDHLTPLEIMEVCEVVEKTLLFRQDYDAAIRILEFAEQYQVDERTKAEFCGLICNLYDYRDDIGDREKMRSCLESGIYHARLAPRPERKHLLAEYLLGMMNNLTRNGAADDDVIDGMILELTDIIEKECLPYSEIPYGFASAMGFYCAEVKQDHEAADVWIKRARKIGQKLYPAGLDYIDNCMIPPAIMYIDMKDYDASEATLLEAVRICDEHQEIEAYRRKAHDLHRYLLDVYLEGRDPSKARQILSVYDNECETYGFSDTVFEEIRQYLDDHS